MQPIKDAQQQAAPAAGAAWLTALTRVVGDEHVLTSFPDRLAYSRDRLPAGNFHYRDGTLFASSAAAVVCPGSVDEVRQVMRVARQYGVKVIPYGLGSGVLGGTVPLGGELILDVRRLDRILALDRDDGLVTVEAGMNGGLFEAALNAAGATSGHYPQCLNISSVGGWAACRGAGQASSRYGKIEDMVSGLKVVLPDGELLEVRAVPRRAVGPSIKDVFLGAEGTLGVIVELTLKIWPVPATDRYRTLAFPTYRAGLEALRRVFQLELRPSVVRLYDELESAPRTAAFPGFETNPILCILSFVGHPAVAAAEERATLDVCREEGATEPGDGPAREWLEKRYHSYSPRHVAAGGVMDTIEIAGRWSAVGAMYEEARAAAARLRPDATLSAHWSHVYSDGACMYMTMKLPPGDDAANRRDHARIWEIVMRASLDNGGTISHHHGVGLFRNRWVEEELNQGFRVVRAIKDALDPDHLLNPGKLGL